MCTVSFVKTKEGVIITSNRDEKIAREKAIPPKNYLINGKELYFPKDPKAGGTWFAHDKQNVIVLLNGAKEKHQSKPNYKKSRGLIVTDLISSEAVLKKWETINLTKIEPFTIVFYNGTNLFQLQWNEVEKLNIKLDTNLNHIWSSATLYEKEIREKRKDWFNQFIKKTNSLTPDALLHFHQFTENSNKEFGLQINRNNALQTVSITQAIVKNNNIAMDYIDLLNK